MALGTAEYYRNKLAVLRESLLRDTLDHQACQIQKELDQVRRSARSFEDKIECMEEELWRIKRELSQAHIDNMIKQREVEKLCQENRDLLFTNWRQEVEIESLQKSLRIYKDANTDILLQSSSVRNNSVRMHWIP